MILEQLQSAIADRYKVERELGRGGMATVFLATDIRHDRQVAIKVLHPDLAATIGSERFEREIKLAAKLQHPHILGLIDSGASDGLFYYVMPFIKGESVRDKLDREKQLSVDEAIQIALEVADALGYAHEHDIIHRDIKPENVMMSNGHALVADFGIARARTEAGQSKLTQTGMAVGTPVYMSPEQATGEAVGPSADIYSLGCMLYEMLAGEPPFNGPNAMAIMARHAMEMVPSIRIVRPSVPEEVEEAILHAMEKNVADRPRTAAEFCEIMGTPLGQTATRRVTGRHTARHRVPTGAAMPRYTGETAAPRVPLYKRPLVLASGLAGLLALVFSVYMAFSGPPASAAVDTNARLVAVPYFKATDSSMTDVAERLTEALIRDLRQIPELQVVSASGVAMFRGRDIAPDSIARALEVGTIVEGSVGLRGDQVEVTTRLYDASGAALDNAHVERVSQDSLNTAELRVARSVGENLREQIGIVLRDIETRSSAGNATAYRLFSRADRALTDAQSTADTALRRAHFASADSLARLASVEDSRWVEPLTLRSEIALRRRVLARDATTQLAWLDSAAEFTRQALELDQANGRALTLRGQITHARSAQTLTPDKQARAALLDQAQRELEEAANVPEARAEANATLSFVHYDKKDISASMVAATNAYNADKFLSNTSLILNRLFWAAYNLADFNGARSWCERGGARFPANAWFTECALWLLLVPQSPVDTTRAIQLKARLDSLTSQRLRQLIGQMVVAGVIGRQAMAANNSALMERARNMLAEAASEGRANRLVDPQQELPGYEAVILAQIGQNDEAIARLTRYVAVNPDHSFRVDDFVHWWWKGIESAPGFKRLLDQSPR